MAFAFVNRYVYNRSMMRRAHYAKRDGHASGKQRITMKIGKAKAPGIAGYKPPRKANDPERPYGYAGEGAPSKYRPEYCQSIVEYFSYPESWTLNTDAKGGAKAIPAGKLPTFERYAASLGVSDRTMDFWQEAHPEFKEAYAIAKSLQKAFILELSAAGVGNNNMGLLLRAAHGMKEPKEEVDLDNTPIQKVVVEVVGASQHKGD